MSYLKIEYYENGQVKYVEASQFMGKIRLKNMEPLTLNVKEKKE